MSKIALKETDESLIDVQQNNLSTNAPDVVSSLHEDNVVVIQRESDGYINATKMAQASGKRWDKYIDNQETLAVLEEISKNTKIPRKWGNSGVDTPGLVDSRRGRNGGTWVHPRVAIHFAGWISPKFAAAVTDVVDRYTKGEVTTEESKSVKAKIDKGKQKAGKGEKVRQQDAYGDQWWVYVRCYLKSMLSPNEVAEGVVILTRELIKFGITGVLSTRDSGYSNDRGYFEYAFQCSNYSEGKLVESMTGADFVGCKLEGKQEYLKVPKAANVLGVFIDTNGATEDQYSYLALNLFAKIVKTLHDINPEHKGKFGYKFEAIPPQTGSPEESGSSTTLTRHTFVRRELTAEDMPPSYETLFAAPNEKIRKLELDAEVEKHRITATTTAISELTSEALANPQIDSEKMTVFLKNIQLAFAQSSGQSENSQPAQPAAAKPTRREIQATAQQAISDSVKRFITEKMVRERGSNVLWVDVFAAYKAWTPEPLTRDPLRAEMLKHDCVFKTTELPATAESPAVKSFRGFKGWKLR